jgi:phage shock protein PspC (stress-responsive transcriptional regulator)
MRTVNSISLNGNAWQIESEGCAALAAYLKGAETRLAGDPDREEILADLEQAIADKLSRHVSAHKNVVNAEEIAQALKEMGPVETGAAPGPEVPADGAAQAQSPGSADSAAPGAAGAAPQGQAPSQVGAAGRHLFRIREGGMLSGVCNGLAAYFGIDVTLVRVVFVVFSVLTGGIGFAVYLVMMIVVPVAVTAEQMAAAHGKPFNAEELIGRPHGPQASFAAGQHWRQQWRDQRRMWRDQRRQWRHQQRAWNGPGVVPPPPPSYGWHGAPYPGNYGPPPVGFGPMSALVRALMLIAFLFALVGAAAGRPILGWDWAAVVPTWVGIIAVCVIYGTLVKQMRMAHYYGHVGTYSPGHALLALFGSIVWLLILVSAGWYLVHHWPEAQDFLQRALQAIQAAFDSGPRNTVST